MIKTIVLCLALSISSIGFTQSTREFGKILEEEFNMQQYVLIAVDKLLLLIGLGRKALGQSIQGTTAISYSLLVLEILLTNKPRGLTMPV